MRHSLGDQALETMMTQEVKGAEVPMTVHCKMILIRAANVVDKACSRMDDRSFAVTRARVHLISTFGVVFILLSLPPFLTLYLLFSFQPT